ncbi:phosphate transport system regulatory protein PhoU [Oceanobacillus piezotolerans]|uniref:Phosphate-specific transport system accessory protein PhoU n=1 Tax=Oceanobacillus piezotolerans TaxID=2448030 RepID=A0A498DG13_9BACI|nr:phosphate signaling complex protein PhoU [Oceanobacillus piezotolerans]RLL42938.1 phosphate transport system regulatory protein PhoU [Oceanobacillus piezotolerans]
MATRDEFSKEMIELDEKIVTLMKLSGEALIEAIDAFYKRDLDKARRIIENDKNIDRLEMEINDQTILMIAKQHPVAKDLRRIIVVLRIVTDIERMADNAKNIATSTIHLGNNYTATAIHDELKKMQKLTLEMLDQSILAFENDDIVIAGQLGIMDDQVDKLYKDIVSELLGEKATDPVQIQYVMQVAFIARYLERFADHITNIGESIIYLVKGVNFSLN